MSKKLGLSMIVKNEHHVILRCLNSVASFIDYWIISDNGGGSLTIRMKIIEDGSILFGYQYYYYSFPIERGLSGDSLLLMNDNKTVEWYDSTITPYIFI